MENNFFKIDFNFDDLVFTDYISSSIFCEMEDFVKSKCFEEDNYLPHMRKASILMAFLKYCSNLDVSEYSDEELYAVCVYSNLANYIESLLHNDNKLKFIITQLEDYIDYHKDKLIHSNKLDNIINYIIDYLSTIDKNELLEKIQTNLGANLQNE